MNYTDITDQALLDSLQTAGRTPPVTLIEECVKRQAALTPALLVMLEHSFADDWEDENDPRWYRGIHAGRLLIAYREEAALPLFERLYASLDDEFEGYLEWFELDVAHYGPTAVSPFTRVLKLDTQGEYHYGRSLACAILSIIALQHPQTREGILQTMRALLPSLRADGSLDLEPDVEPHEIWGDLAAALADLRDEVSRPQVEELLADDRIDSMMCTLESYQAALAPDAPPPDEADFRYDILGMYGSAVREEKSSAMMAARRDLLRDQGILWPKPDPQPYANPVSNWFNDKVLNLPQQKIGRNEPCPCGSDKKYKKCHGQKGSPPLP
ncbi:MAG: DUF1186 domain-containing protein [Chloroflexota bacterium]